MLHGESPFINAIAPTVQRQVRSLTCLRRGQRRDRQPAAAIKLSRSVLGLLLESVGGSLGRKGKRCFFTFTSLLQCLDLMGVWPKTQTQPKSDCQDLHVNYATITSFNLLITILGDTVQEKGGGGGERKWKTNLQNSECSLSLFASNRSSIITCSLLAQQQIGIYECINH